MGNVHWQCSTACADLATNCARNQNDLEEDRQFLGGDPAGATFDETLEDLNSLDRNLLLFCATSNLSAVLWLRHLGAHWDACDANSTTCLHAACRTGSLAVVKEIMRHEPLLHADDCSGWTPLHIAVLMGRRDVVVGLLQAGASQTQKNHKGQVPSELCADSATSEALQSFRRHDQLDPDKPWRFLPKDAASAAAEEMGGSQLRDQPFFVPRSPLISSGKHKQEFRHAGVQMFSRQPGRSLAFLVASGVLRDHPVNLSLFLRRSAVDVKQVGSLLGESFSVAHTIRLEFMNAAMLQNTGIVSALMKVCHALQLPEDLQKINRLLQGAARIWWRRHERLGSSGAKPAAQQDAASPNKGGPVVSECLLQDEIVGIKLKESLNSSETLQQLMFSAVLLHWYVHNDGTGPKREIDFDTWKLLTVPGESAGVSDDVMLSVHTLISGTFIPELSVAVGGRPSGREQVRSDADEGGSRGGLEDADSASKSEMYCSSGVNGWARILGGGFIRHPDRAGMGSLSPVQTTSIFSEAATTSTRGACDGPMSATRLARNRQELGETAGFKKDGPCWLSVLHTILFFSVSATSGCPYAFLQLPHVHVSQIHRENFVITITGKELPSTSNASDFVTTPSQHREIFVATPAPATASEPKASPVVVILLLPDGRWEEMKHAKLELQFQSESELDMWINHFNREDGGGGFSAADVWIEMVT